MVVMHERKSLIAGNFFGIPSEYYSLARTVEDKKFVRDSITDELLRYGLRTDHQQESGGSLICQLVSREDT